MKRMLLVIFLITVCCVFSIPALADPPANDDCEDATVIGNGILYPDSSMVFTGNNVDATNDCTNHSKNEVWIKFTTETCMHVTVSYEGTTPYFNYIVNATYLYDSCPCGDKIYYLYGMGYEDGNSGGYWESLPAGTYYYPVVYEPGLAEGDYLITVSGTECAPPPANDSCQYATVVGDGILDVGETMTFTGDNSGVTNDCEIVGYSEAWITFTTLEDMNVTIDYCGTSPAFDNSYDGLFTECPCGDVIFWQNSDQCDDSNPLQIWYNLPAGTYLYPVIKSISVSGEYIVNVTGELWVGACCLDEGMTCYDDVSESYCLDSLGGDWMGIGSVCGEYNEEDGYEGCQEMSVGACCLSDDMVCIENVTEDYCEETLDGTWMGEGSICGEYDEETGYEGCQEEPTTGACCYDDGDCADTDEETCLGLYEGIWMGEGTECGGYNEETGYEGCQEEPTTGACCYDDGFSCVDTDETTCLNTYEGTWMGLGTECGGYSEETGYEGCQEEPTTGACCYDDGFGCVDTDETTCLNTYEGTWMGLGTECGGYSEEVGYEGCQEEPTTGACCYDDGFGCVDTDETTCLDTYEGTWMGLGTECGGYSEETGYEGCQEEPTTGACCYDDGFGCVDTDETTCLNTYEGTWMGLGTECGGYSEETGYEGCQQGTSYEYLPGDANMASETWPAQTIGGDVTYLVNYFRGLADACMLDGFYASADATGDCMVVGGDVTYLVNYFRGLADMSYCSDYEPAWPTPSDVPADAPDGWPNCD